MRLITARISMATALACGALLPHPLVVGQAAPPPPPPPLPQVQPFQILTPPGLKTPTGPAIVPVVPNQIATPSPIPVVTFPTQTGPLTNLTWDSEQKEYNSKPGDLNANFTFWFTNTSSEEVIINAVRTSCGCTVAKLAATPWHLPPGTNGPIEVTVDLRGKSGAIAKAVTVESSAGIKSLIVKMNIAVGGVATDFTVTHPNMGDAERLKNMQDSLKDRQVVFKDAKCATCHADPAKGQVDGGVIYRGVCATCHDSQLRAAAVTDLKSLKHETDLDYWKMWISNGREGTMMPAYAEAHGGPLSETQINALALYCLNSFKPAAQNGATAPVPPSPAAAAPAAAPAAIATNAAVALPSVSIFPLPKSK